MSENAYPKFYAIQVSDYAAKTQPISGYHAGFKRVETYAVQIITSNRCRGFISTQRYKNFESAQKAANRYNAKKEQTDE